MSIQTAIFKLDTILSTKTAEVKSELYKKMDIESIDLFHFLDINAQEFASGHIDLELSQFLYNKLRAYEKTTLAERIVISEIMADILKKRKERRIAI